MPTFRPLPRLRRELNDLTSEQQGQFLAMVRLVVASLRAGNFDPRLRVKCVRGHEGIWEVT